MFLKYDNILINLADLGSITMSEDPPEMTVRMRFSDTFVIRRPAHVLHAMSEAIEDYLDSESALVRPEDLSSFPEDLVMLSSEEEAELKLLLDEGYAWIARDIDQTIWAYEYKPERNGRHWEELRPITLQPRRLRTEWYRDITADMLPMSIVFLLVGP